MRRGSCEQFLIEINIDWERNFQTAIQEYATPAPDVALSAVGGANLIVDYLLLPALPVEQRVLVGFIELPALPVKEYEHVILKNGEEITEFILIIFNWIGIAP